ncbi:MAG: ribonuclease P protein component, partial [bacterium]|nr:ribonuclease P protein component [bacterium]
MRKASIGRENRLKSREYDLVFERGKRVKSDCFDVIALKGQSGPRKLGIIVSKKVGKAVVRNRVKRRMREILRQEAELFDDGIHIAVVVKPSAVSLRFGDLEDAL